MIKKSKKAVADLITLNEETIDENKPLELFDPIYTWKKKKLTNYYAKELMVQIFKEGKPVYESPDVMSIREFALNETERLWPEVLRFENPHTYYVDLSYNLWNMKQELLHKYSEKYKE